MKIVSIVFVFNLLFFFGFYETAIAKSDRPQPLPSSKIEMKCVGISKPQVNQSATQTSTQSASQNITQNVTPTNMSFIFSNEANNANEIAVDTFLTDVSGRKVKQIGHADLETADEIHYQSAADSAFQFTMTLGNQNNQNFETSTSASGSSANAVAQTAAASSYGQNFNSATISAIELFSGQSLTDISVICRQYEFGDAKNSNPITN